MSLNIGGADDEFFRYKMPELLTKVEGRGNGIKTVLPNMAEVAMALKRDPGYPTKFFALELGALSKWDEQRNVGIVNGAHTKETMAKLLADFIERYVLCYKCKLPETDLKIKGGLIYQKCKACGFRGESDNKHKLSKYIVNHPPPKTGKEKKKDKEKDEKKAKKDKKDKEKPKEKKASSKKTGEKSEDADGSQNDEEGNDNDNDNDDGSQDDGSGDGESPNENGGAENGDEMKDAEDEGEISFEVTAEMLSATAEKTRLDDIVDPISEMKEVLSSESSAEKQFEKVKQLQTSRGFSDEERLQYVVKAVITCALGTQLKANVNLLKLVCASDRASQLQLIALLEERCETFPSNLNDVSSVLMVLYDEDLLEEEIIVDWHAKGLSQLYALADIPAAEATRKAADKFVDWVSNAEEESDEE